MPSLESKLNKAFKDLNISYIQQESLQNYLTVLRNHDFSTYQHSIRIGLAGAKVAEMVGMNPKALFYSGLMHDIGKSGIDGEILRKTKGYTEADHEQMMGHPLYSYILLEDVHDFSAEVALRHHTHQGEPYPKDIPKSKVQFSEETLKLIDEVSKVISGLDACDASITRKNERSRIDFL
jgi:HD-GYP domain-containing protein (c-di-GMP phosphodiesterase class II)